MNTDFQTLVIGGGSAGHAAARTAASLGLRTALIESADKLGGLCILRGCMPSKTLIETANRLRDIRDAGRFGIEAEPAVLNIDALRSRLHTLIGDFQSHREEAMTHAEYELIRGTARFISQNEITVETTGGTRKLRSDTFIIAAGSSPVVPDIPGLDDTPFWTSDDVVRMPSLPEKIVIIGSGAIGMECAHLYEGFGSRVTILVRGSGILSAIDPDIAGAIEQESLHRGITILRHTETERVRHSKGTFHIDLNGPPHTLEADALLVATGRSPATKDLGLEDIGLEMERGRIVIDEETATSHPHIFAAGDCASPLPVVHLAVIQGETAARNAARFIHGQSDAPATWSADTAMRGWFTDPQCAEIGLSEKEAVKRGITIHTGRADYADHGKGMIAGSRHGFVKVIVDAKDGLLIGAAAAGPHVIETSHLMQFAIARRMTARAYLELPHYHPTLAEAWARAVGEAAGKAD